MDLVLEYADEYLLDSVYASLLPAPTAQAAGKLASNATLAASAATAQAAASTWARDNIYRQSVSLFVISAVAALFLYFVFSSLSYYFLYDKRLEHHPRFLPRQKYQEIMTSVISVPFMDFLTLPWFVGEVRGKSKLYSDVAEYGWPYFIFSAVWFLVFTDFLIYVIHAAERKWREQLVRVLHALTLFSRPPLGVQVHSQAPPQVDRAYSLRCSCLPPS